MKTVLSKKTELVSITCKLSDDRIKLFIDIDPLFPAERQIDSVEQEELKREVCNTIEDLVKHDFIDLDVLSSALNEALDGKKIEQRRIVKGQTAGEAKPGKIVYLVKKLGGNIELKVDEKGRTDFKELNLFDNIEIGQIVARLYPPIKGTDGIDALGQPIKGADGKPAVFQLDNSLELLPPSADQTYSTIKAKVAGYLFQNGEKLAIVEQLKINGDVDYTTGNINFIGGVVVDGNIRQGFSVKAVKDIEVKGAVESANIISLNGSITIKGLAAGTALTLIKAAKDINLNIAQNQRIEAGENVSIIKEARSCTIEAQSIINMPAGKLVGGEAIVVCGLEAGTIGNEAGVKTTIKISSNMEMGQEYNTIRQNILAHERAIELVKLHLGPLAKNTTRIQYLKPELREKMQSLANKLEQLNKSIIKLNGAHAHLLTQGKRSSLARINFNKAMLPGATILSSDALFEVKDPIAGPKTLQFDTVNKEFQIIDKLPLECNFEILQGDDNNDKQ